MISDAVSQPTAHGPEKYDFLEHALQIATQADEAPYRNASCAADIWMSVFFDGTGNSRFLEETKPPRQRAFTNVAHLFFAHRAPDTVYGIYRLYVPGVGTPFPEIGDAGGDLEQATGAKGTERLDWVETQLRRGIDEQKQKGFKVKTIHLAVFGFSRGSKLARAFVSKLFGKSAKQNGKLLYNEIVLRIYFVGIFDTVASVGMPRDHSTYGRDLAIPEVVEKCVHIVAGHELRFAFPLDSIRRNGKYIPGSTEYVFPGVHADVGGGYAQNEQGRDNAYAAVPLNLMLEQARLAGVPFAKESSWTQEVAQSFKVSDALKQTFEGYMAALEPTGHSIEETMFAHLKLYWRWRRLRMNDASAPIPTNLKKFDDAAKQENANLSRQRQAIDEQDRSIVNMAMFTGMPVSDEQANTLRQDAQKKQQLDAQMEANKAYAIDRNQWKEADHATLAEANALLATVKGGHATTWQKAILAAWSDTRPLPKDSIDFFDHYMHDSQAAWAHYRDQAAVALIQNGASQTCAMAFSKIAVEYCTKAQEESDAGTVQFLRPRTLFFGEKEDIFAVTDTGY